MFCDYHLHTWHSMDCEQSLTTLCTAAVQKGLQEICLTDHYEPHHPRPGSDVPPLRENLLPELEEARARFPMLRIKLGIEIGDFPQWHCEIVEWLEHWPLDYRLLSLHLVEGLDPYFQEYFDHYEQDRVRAYRAYAQALCLSVRSWKPEEYDALAHIGYVAKKAPYGPAERPLRWKDAPEEIDEVLQTLALHGKALEINTSGYPVFQAPLPNADVLTRFKALGGEFVIFGSDAHVPENVGQFMPDAYAMAIECGFRYTLSFDKRKPTPLPIPTL